MGCDARRYFSLNLKFLKAKSNFEHGEKGLAMWQKSLMLMDDLLSVYQSTTVFMTTLGILVTMYVQSCFFPFFLFSFLFS